MNPPAIAISRRQKTPGPNHHLWNNHGIWWLHCTVHRPDGTADRLRASLKTADLPTARRRRDAVLAARSLKV